MDYIVNKGKHKRLGIQQKLRQQRRKQFQSGEKIAISNFRTGGKTEHADIWQATASSLKWTDYYEIPSGYWDGYWSGRRIQKKVYRPLKCQVEIFDENDA